MNIISFDNGIVGKQCPPLSNALPLDSLISTNHLPSRHWANKRDKNISLGEATKESQLRFRVIDPDFPDFLRWGIQSGHETELMIQM